MKITSLIFTIAFAFGAAPLVAAPVTMHLKGDRVLTVDFDRANKDGVVWRLNPSDASTQLTPLSEISHIDFPPPVAWEEAERILATGDLDAALEKFSAIAANQFNLGYPVPGNFASKALLEILDIRRRQLDAAAIANQARIVKREAPTLHPGERNLPPVIESWVALGKEDWETALKSLEAIENGNSEVSYLRGRALEGSGESESAIEAYAATYALGIGNNSEMSRDALRRSAQLLETLDKEARFPELHAQLKLYAELYGAGSLWADAPDHLSKTAAAELDTITGMIDKPIATTEDIPAATLYDLSEQPPLEERDWLLFQELEHPAYVVGQPPLNNEGAEKTETGWHFNGDGGVLVAPGNFDADGLNLRIRLTFTPTAPDGILVSAPAKGGGFALYLKERELVLHWSHDGETPKDYSFGRVNLNQRNSLYLTISNRVLKPRLQNEPVFTEEVKVDGALDLGEPIALTVGGPFGKEFRPAPAIPPFAGAIHHLSIGMGKSLKEVGDQERAMFGGKRIVSTPQLPPDPDAPAPGATPTVAATPGTPAPAPDEATTYVPPQLTYDLSTLPRPDDRDYLLPQELEHRIAFIGRPPAENKGAEETETGWVFNGESSVIHFKPVSFMRKRFRIRVFFTPNKPDAVILHGGIKNTGILGLYLDEGDLILACRRSTSPAITPETFHLGRILLGTANVLSITLTDKNQVVGNLNGQRFPAGQKVNGQIIVRPAVDLRLSGRVGALIGDRKLPQFEGTIHCLTLGLDTSQKKITEAELKTWNGKKLRFNPPPGDGPPPPLVPKIAPKP